jgi:hypothetical protein
MIGCNLSVVPFTFSYWWLYKFTYEALCSLFCFHNYALNGSASKDFSLNKWSKHLSVRTHSLPIRYTYLELQSLSYYVHFQGLLKENLYLSKVQLIWSPCL